MQRFLIVSAMLTSATAAQDLIHYKFDSTCTGEVINYAVGSAIGNGTIEARVRRWASPPEIRTASSAAP